MMHSPRFVYIDLEKLWSLSRQTRDPAQGCEASHHPSTMAKWALLRWLSLSSLMGGSIIKWWYEADVPIICAPWSTKPVRPTLLDWPIGISNAAAIGDASLSDGVNRQCGKSTSSSSVCERGVEDTTLNGLKKRETAPNTIVCYDKRAKTVSNCISPKQLEKGKHASWTVCAKRVSVSGLRTVYLREKLYDVQFCVKARRLTKELFNDHGTFNLPWNIITVYVQTRSFVFASRSTE